MFYMNFVNFVNLLVAYLILTLIIPYQHCIVASVTNVKLDKLSTTKIKSTSLLTVLFLEK